MIQILNAEPEMERIVDPLGERVDTGLVDQVLGKEIEVVLLVAQLLLARQQLSILENPDVLPIVQNPDHFLELRGDHIAIP